MRERDIQKSQVIGINRFPNVAKARSLARAPLFPRETSMSLSEPIYFPARRYPVTATELWPKPYSKNISAASAGRVNYERAQFRARRYNLDHPGWRMHLDSIGTRRKRGRCARNIKNKTDTHGYTYALKTNEEGRNHDKTRLLRSQCCEDRENESKRGPFDREKETRLINRNSICN